MTHLYATAVCQTKTRLRNGKKACDMVELHGLVETKCWKMGQVREWMATYQKHSKPAMLLLHSSWSKSLAPANISVSRIRGTNRSNLSKGGDICISFSFRQAQLSMFATTLTSQWCVSWDWKIWLCPASDKWKASFCQHWCRFAPCFK